MIDELWKPFPGFCKYEISDHGRVRHVRTGHFLQLKLISGGTGGRGATNGRSGHVPYVMVDMMRDDIIDVPKKEQHTRKLVHLAVLETFGSPRPSPDEHGGTFEASHLDGDSSNNRMDNLAWETHFSNNMRRRRHGTTDQGEKNPSAKLTAVQVVSIRERVAAGDKQADIARELNLNIGTINLLVLGKTWQNAGGPITGKQPRNKYRAPAKVPGAAHTVCQRKFCCPQCWTESGHPPQCLTLPDDQRTCAAHLTPQIP